MNLKTYGQLFALFTLICLGLGYPSLNRVDVRRNIGLRDAVAYRAMVINDVPPRQRSVWMHSNYRVLIPYLARPIYRLSAGRVGSWDAAMLGLLVVSSAFTAATALLTLRIGLHLEQPFLVSLLAALLFLLNFSVSNLRLTGLIDAGEGFFLLALVWALLEKRLAIIPLIFFGGALAKETFVVLAAVFGLVWWLASAHQGKTRGAALWLAGGALTGLLTLSLVHWIVGGAVEYPWQFGASFGATSTYLTRYQEFRYLKHFVFVSLLDVNTLYSFLWLAPLGWLNLRQFPKPWLFSTAFTIAVAFALSSYHGSAPGTMNRTIFSIAGPLLSLSAALTIAKMGQISAVSQPNPQSRPER